MHLLCQEAIFGSPSFLTLLLFVDFLEIYHAAFLVAISIGGLFEIEFVNESLELNINSLPILSFLQVFRLPRPLIVRLFSSLCLT